MAASVNDGRNAHSRIFVPDVERAHSLWPIHFVSRDGRQVNVLLQHIDWHLCHGLGGIRVKYHTALMTQLADVRNGLDNADLVIGRHDRNQDRLVIYDALQVFEINQAVFLHRQVGHTIAVLLQPLTAIEHGPMLSDRRDDVIAFLFVHLGDALNSQVVAFGSARGEDDFFCCRADQLSDAFASRLHGLFRRPAE